MLKIPDAVREIILKNPLFKFGIYYRLLNLSRLAEYICPQVEARTKKEVKPSAILMSLSRLQRESQKIAPKVQDVAFENITVHMNLCTFTFFKSQKIHEKINALYEHVLAKRGYMTVTEGVNEITVILDEESAKVLPKVVDESPKNEQHQIAALGIKFSEKFNQTPGLLYLILQQVSLQHINIVEIASTYTELFLYVEKSQVRLAFDTLMRCFR